MPADHGRMLMHEARSPETVPTDREAEPPARPGSGSRSGWRFRVGRVATRGADAGVLSILIGLALWEIAPRAGLVPEQYIPPASVVLPELVRLITTGAFWADVWGTLSGWAVGLLLSVCTAIPLGLTIGVSPYLYRATRAVVEFLRPIPSVALIPLAILVFGITFDMKIFLVTFATFWPLLIQSIYGVQDVDPVARDTARMFGLGRAVIFFKVMLPSAAPYIATGLRLASALGIILAITAELVAGVDGLGRSILLTQSAGDNDTMYALIVATGLLSYLLSSGLRQLERRVLRWHQSHRQETA
jgi:ABC-type nitrate/sulfonate/bicarbonate transport system permease component